MVSPFIGILNLFLTIEPEPILECICLMLGYGIQTNTLVYPERSSVSDLVVSFSSCMVYTIATVICTTIYIYTYLYLRNINSTTYYYYINTSTTSALLHYIYIYIYTL